jgi:predicted aldo/keto reductase-like oxidoreductase
MTKIDGRRKKVAMKQLDQSLKRLKTDHVDLLQIHEVIRPGDAERIFARGGAIEAMEKAREQGKARYLGFTGHKDPAFLLEMLGHGFSWDAAQFPVNLLDARFNSFQQQFLPRLREEGVGIIAMKPLAGGALMETKMVTAAEALRYALSQPVDVVVTGMESQRDLDQALEAAGDFQPLSEEAREKLFQRIAPFAANGEYEPYKTSDRHDGTVHNPHWLEKAKV